MTAALIAFGGGALAGLALGLNIGWKLWRETYVSGRLVGARRRWI